jgi:hypothetical protein
MSPQKWKCAASWSGGGVPGDRCRDRPADLLPRIFDVLVQGRQAQAADGLGLRLTLVRRLVELHHGRVTASSDGAGRGAEFVLRLPLLVGRRGAMCSKPRPHRRRRRTGSGS